MISVPELVTTLKYLKSTFQKGQFEWMVVSGTSVFYYNNPDRKITDIDVVVKAKSLSEVENLLKNDPEIDGLSRVKFIDKFGEVEPLTKYLRMNLKGVQVHVSNDWVYRIKGGSVVKIPFDAKAFKDANEVKVDGFKVKIALPELIFFCKSITRRTYRDKTQLIQKDLLDCKSLAKYHSFDPDYLEALYRKTSTKEIADKIAKGIVERYTRKP